MKTGFRIVAGMAAALSAGVVLSACSLFCPTADSVFDHAEDAVAPDSLAETIETAQFMYELNGGKGTAMVRYKAPGSVRIDVLDGTNTVAFCMNGAEGWMYLGGEVEKMTTEDIVEMHKALLQTLPFQVNMQDVFGDAVLEPKTEFAAGEECRVISAKFRREPKQPVKLWFGRKSRFLRQFEVTREDGTHTMQYFDYRDYNGIHLAAVLFDFSDAGSKKIMLTSFEINTPIPDSVFQPPQKFN